MENATDALKMAFSVFVFVMSLTIAITTFSKANQVSQIVLNNSDETKYYTYETFENKSRIVGLETIIPTLYKYYKENYTVLFLDAKGEPLPLYESQTNRSLWGSGEDGYEKSIGTIGRYYTTNETQYSDKDEKAVCTFDVKEETTRHEPWTGSTLDFKKNLDAFLNGGTFQYPSKEINENTGSVKEYDYGKGFISNYKQYKFKEFLGEYTYNVDETSSSSLLKNRKKRVIIYQVQQ